MSSPLLTKQHIVFTSKQSTWWNSVTSRCMDMAQRSEWVTKPAWMTKIPIPKSRKSVQKRFKGKSRSIEAKFAFLRRHFFADFLSKRRFSECRWWWSWQSSHSNCRQPDDINDNGCGDSCTYLFEGVWCCEIIGLKVPVPPPPHPHQ